MVSHREMNLDDYLAILRRRIRWFLLPAVLGPLLGYAITLALTPRYTSTSLILIEQPTVPDSVVPSSNNNDLFTRLATMQEQILSRNRLQPLIERYDLYRDARQRSMEDAVEQMRDAIKVQPVQFASTVTNGASSNREVPGFSISFTGNNARVAQQVCSELTTMFMDENIKQQEQTAQNTTDFLSAQIADAKRKLDEQEAKLAEFKRQHLGALPDEQQSNLQILTGLNTQLAAASEALNRAQQDKAYAQALLQQQWAAWQAAISGESPATLQDQLKKEQDELAVLEARYTPDYPDVIKLKHDIAELQKKILAQAAHKNPAAPAASAFEPPQIQQLRAQLRQDEEIIRAETREQARIERQIRNYEARVQMTPLVEQQFKELTLGHETALEFYNKLLASRNQSQMSADLQSRQQGETFRVLDSASLPLEPSFPVWWQFTLGGLGAGVALGLMLAFFREYRDKSLRDERDIAFYLELPTLALVPSLDPPNGRRGARKAPPGKPRALKAEA